MHRLAPILLPLLWLSACGPPEAAAPTEFNSLPTVDAELNDADPLYEGATVVVTLVDDDGEECSLAVEVSFDGGANYAPATVASSDHADLTTIPCTRAGTRFTLVWETEADLGDASSNHALVRFTPHDAQEQGPPDHLPIELDLGFRTVNGIYVERAGATGAQYSFQRMGFAHLAFYGHSVEVGEEYLAGDDRYQGKDEVVVWEYDLPDPPPEHHFHALDLGNGHGGSGAFYLPFVWKDSEEDAEDPTFDAGEDLVGVGGRTLVGFLRPDGDWTGEGWQVIQVDPFAATDDQLQLLPETTEIPVFLKAYPVNGTTADFTLDIPVDGVGGLPLSPPHRCGWMPWFSGSTAPPDITELASVPMAGNLTTLSFEIHDEDVALNHWLGTPWGFFADDVAVERLYLYVDDGPDDDQVNPGEHATHLGTDSSDGEEISLTYVRGTLDWDTLWDWALDGCWAGFNLVTSYPTTPAGIPGWACHPLDAAPSVTFEPHGAAH